MLIAIALVTVAAFVGSSLLAVTGAASSLVAAHVLFAIGIVPLIVAAITHFVPVLTRTRSPGRTVLALPFAAQLAGLAAVGAMHGLLPRPALHAAATADLGVALAVAGWVWVRARKCLGTPHPGWRWYPAALTMFALSLAGVLAMAIWPDHYPALRNLHLHLNTLGLVGLAAFGTLPVLLPTAFGKPDPAASPWLRRHLALLAGGVLGTASAAALAPTAETLSLFVGAVGIALLATSAGTLLAQWRRRFGWHELLGDGSAVALLSAVSGWIVLSVGAVLHAPWLGVSRLSAQAVIAAYAGMFLLPLVTGALTQLLPVWRFPGVVTPARQHMRAMMAQTGRWRALLFLTGGTALICGQAAVGATCILIALLLFVAGVLRALLTAR